MGYRRSGTTLLQSLLGAHPRIAAPPEMHFILRVACSGDLFGDLADDANLRRALHEALNPPLDVLSEGGFAEDDVFERARRGPRTYAGLFAAIMEDYAERNGKARWTDTTPEQRPDDILDLFPDALLLHIVRDPREVVASSLDMPSEKRSAASVARDLRHFTLEAIERGRHAGEAQYMRVRYEDLTSNPDVMLRAICGFIGEDFDERMASERPRPATAGRWRSRLGWADRLRVQAITEDLLLSLGYGPPTRAAHRLGPLVRGWVRLRSAIPDRRGRATSAGR